MKPRKIQLGEPGLQGEYRLNEAAAPKGTTVTSFTLALGQAGDNGQWIILRATKVGGGTFSLRLLASSYPLGDLAASRKTISRYIFQEGDKQALEFKDRFTGRPVLPRLGAWEYLLPRAETDVILETGFAKQVRLLGHGYELVGQTRLSGDLLLPPGKILELTPDVLIGPPHNTRQKDATRRFDGSDYEYARLTREDYETMLANGITCVNADAEQTSWIEDLPVFYWGLRPSEIRFPEHLYRSNYLGPTIFFDEPMVHTRDFVIRPRLAESDAFKRDITPQKALHEFKTLFDNVLEKGASTRLAAGLRERGDADLGDMTFRQQNLYTWETMVSSAIWQLGRDPSGPPDAIVFEPPGRVGARRVLPEINMCYGCRIPVDDPKNLASIIYGFLRGAARATGKQWGMSVYGQLDWADAPWLQTHAYDLGATRFFYWDNYQLACVPFSEVLSLSRNLMNHVTSNPVRNFEALRSAAETAILLPPGYNLGHVDLGRGNLWGVGELNLERKNSEGVPYRRVMGNYFTEIERCIRLGVAFDLLWDTGQADLTGYREVVKVREDGRLEVRNRGVTDILDGARIPERPDGAPPSLKVGCSMSHPKAPCRVSVEVEAIQGDAPLYYTVGANNSGVYVNEVVLFELFGPEDYDYAFLNTIPPVSTAAEKGSGYLVTKTFMLDKPGAYRLRSAACDLTGRTCVVWTDLVCR
ncbi:MAG TPA: hypothetical protein PL033_08890 [Candidatus Brocadiia bacterium]|nr:hypothetical protein [Candidatus Brocadiia bacterium]